MRNAEIKYKFELTKESVKGKIIELIIDLDELQESDIWVGLQN